MRRGRAIGIGAVATLLAVAVATGAAAGVSQLTQGPDTAASSAASPAASPASPATTGAGPSAAAESTAPATPTPSATPTPTVTDAPVLKERPVLAPGDEGLQVRELQARLQQLRWYEPEMTGAYDEVTEAAVHGFQAKRGFEATGVVDRRTWQRVVEMSRMPTDDEMHNRLVPGPTLIGPASSGDEVRELQARLKQIGWFSGDVTDNYGDITTAAVAGFQTKREIPSTGEVDQRTMDRLLAMTTEPTRDELRNRYQEAAPSTVPLDPRCQTGRVLCIDKSSNSLRWVVDGAVQTTVDVRFGSEELPTREGAFSVNYKSRDHVSSLYDTPMPYAMFFSGGQAVHYSPDFAANGYNGASHGCVNVRDLGAVSALFDQVNVGDKVIVYWS